MALTVDEVGKLKVARRRKELQSRGLAAEGRAPDLKSRLLQSLGMEASIATKSKSPDALGDAIGPGSASPAADSASAAESSCTPAALQQRIESMPEAQRDYIAGKRLRQAEIDFYNRCLREGVADIPPTFVSKGKTIEGEDVDRVLPGATKSWAWKYFHLRRSTNLEIVYCNKCCGDKQVGPGFLGCAKHHGNTKNLDDHLKRHHQITKAQHEKVEKG